MENNHEPLILISNDDGYQFNGIKTLIAVARHFGEVVVVAPAQHQSGMGSAITITRPLRAIAAHKEKGLTVYLVDGTPADCAKLALDQLLGGRKPDLVLAGINHGLNMGVCTLYSGTLGVVFEACLHGIDSVAFSYGDYSFSADMTPCVPIVEQVIGKVLARRLPQGVCLNVNIPYNKGEIKGLKVATSCMGRWVDEFERRTDPHGIDYYWITGEYYRDDPEDDATDMYWLDHGWVTVTPCKIDQTAHEAMAQISDLLL